MPPSIDRRLIRALLEVIESRTVSAKLRMDAVVQLQAIRAAQPDKTRKSAPASLLGS